ncbi:hypothetical protein CMsap09_03410 [Clavibacter michiganensis]|uniref:Uncharacterized protein n=1 Tax=Clavibacter michiganensis TaxID=28447 RepID=A0A251XRU3_9MICO|nr:hypothetical protein CMsap09_03410 [Clavibacter michiganensis]
MSGARGRTALLVVAALAVVGGAAALVRSSMQPVTLYSFGYEPTVGDTFSTPGVHVLATGTLAAAVVLAAGLVLLAFWAGLRLGRRRGGGH